MDTDYDNLSHRLAEAQCPHKLYPARLRALEIVTGERLLPQIEEVITMRVSGAGGNKGWKLQFQSDFNTYGLMEAILYFHSYPTLAGDFVEDACSLYERLATLYLAHHEEILASDDPRIGAQLEYLRRFGDMSQHTVPKPPQRPRSAPNGIAAPEPGLQAGELLERLLGSYMVDAFPGVQGAFFEVARTLEENGVDVFGAEGQDLLESLVGLLRDEAFGDFERWIPCVSCGRDFIVTLSLESVNDSLLAAGWRCDECREQQAV